MIVTLLLSRLHRLSRSSDRFSWAPALDLTDASIFSTLLPTSHS